MVKLRSKEADVGMLEAIRRFPDLADPEGPVSLPDGSWLVTEMGRGRITQILATGARTTVMASSRPNGLAVDADGGLWIAESIDRALLHRDSLGVLETVSVGVDDTPFLWPNDLCFGPDGWLYMTDSGIEVGVFETDPTTTMVDGRLFRVDPRSGATELLDRRLGFANGIAFGPDGWLYVAETLTGEVSRYPFEAGRIGGRSRFATVVPAHESTRSPLVGPDGLAFDASGNLLVAVLGRGDITVVDRHGHVTSRVRVPGTFPTNVAFGQPGTRSVAVSEGSRGELLILPWPVDGHALHQPFTR